MQKRGRPPAPFPTEQVTVRLDRAMLGEFRRGRGVSAEIQERLARSIQFDQQDTHLRKLVGQIDELAKEVWRTLGVEWHEDQKAHRTFIEVLRRLFADLPIPEFRVSDTRFDSIDAAELIYNRYVRSLHDFERGAKRSVRTSASLKNPETVGHGLIRNKGEKS